MIDETTTELEANNQTIIEKIKNLPSSPGVYIYKNDKGKIIYIGKAINLRNRVKSYFQKSRTFDAKTKALVRHIADMEYIVTDNEAEALILEDTLIKRHKPKYNIMLRDDKTYPFIRITNEEFPRIFPTRKVVRDGSKYFGPYTDVRTMKRVLRLIRTIFKIRSCNLKLNTEDISKGKFKICLDYQIKKCDGPCEAKISKEDYLNNVKNAIDVINGKTAKVEKFLLNKMEKYAENLKFEQAAYYRNQYLLLKEYSNSQKIVSTELVDRDVFAIALEDDYFCSIVFNIRDGKLIGKRHYVFKNTRSISFEQAIQLTVEKWYLENEFIPNEILLQYEPEDKIFIENFLKEKKQKNVTISVPKLGEKKKLINLAFENAQFQLREYLISIAKKEAEVPKLILQMQKELNLPKAPRIIECFDNSHIQGSDFVSAVVVFKDGKPSKSDYRKFKIKTVNKNDDFAAMYEAVSRRYKRLLDEGKQLPNLVIIDGGKGQLNEAVKVFKELNIYQSVPVIAIAKKLEEIYLPEAKEPLMLPRSSSTLQLIQKIRDETHRFVITYHRKLREKRILDSELLKIPGIGKKTFQKLITNFGSIQNLKSKGFEDLSKVVGIKLAKKIFEYFNEKEK